MICIRDESKVLTKTALFSGMNIAELRRLAFVCSRISFLPGEEMIVQGDEATVGFIILTGEAQQSVETENGTETLDKVGPGYLVGEAAMLAGAPYLITVTATSALEALQIRKEHLLKLLDGSSVNINVALEALSKKIAQAENRLASASG